MGMTERCPRCLGLIEIIFSRQLANRGNLHPYRTVDVDSEQPHRCESPVLRPYNEAEWRRDKANEPEISRGEGVDELWER